MKLVSVLVCLRGFIRAYFNCYRNVGRIANHQWRLGRRRCRRDAGHHIVQCESADEDITGVTEGVLGDEVTIHLNALDSLVDETHGDWVKEICVYVIQK